jgi:Xaa-Pro aminopeptidase
MTPLPLTGSPSNGLPPNGLPSNGLPPLPHDTHLAAVRDRAELGPDGALFVSDLVNIRYLTGFTGSAALLVVGAGSATLVTDERYGEQASAQSGDYADVVAAAPAEQLDVLARALGSLRCLYFDPEQVSVDLHDRLAAAFGSTTLDRRTGIVELARRVKGEAEIVRMRTAARIAVAAHRRVLESLGDEPTEEELAHRFAEAVRDLGGDGVAFPTIVASGPRASMPHAAPSDRRVRAGDVLLMDFGAAVDGYLSDVTRTVVVGGSADADADRIIAAVTEAHDAGIALAGPGVTHADVDAACRRVLHGHGYDGGPTHPFGHQLGLRIHERPFLTSTALEPLEPGNVVTVEPGVYLPGRIGCRVEDTVLITTAGTEVLSSA